MCLYLLDVGDGHVGRVDGTGRPHEGQQRHTAHHVPRRAHAAARARALLTAEVGVSDSTRALGKKEQMQAGKGGGNVRDTLPLAESDRRTTRRLATTSIEAKQD